MVLKGTRDDARYACPDEAIGEMSVERSRGSAPRGLEVRRSRRSPKKRRGGSGQWRVVPFPSRDASASDLSVPFERKISGRPCVGGNPCRAAHQRKRTGGLEDWSDGTMEYWNDGWKDRPPSPAFHHSSIPLFHRPPSRRPSAGARPRTIRVSPERLFSGLWSFWRPKRQVRP